MQQTFDIAFVGNYTKDTIVSASGTRVVDGGAFNYGAHVAASMGLRSAAITRLACEDWHVVERLTGLGVVPFAVPTPSSTCLRLEYPGPNVDERTIYVTSNAGSFTPEQMAGIDARAFVIGASFRGEVPMTVLEALATRGATLALDVQGFVRIARDGVLVPGRWPGKDAVLGLVDILKADAVEAKFLTGTSDIYRAAEMLTGLGPSEIVLTHRHGLLVRARGQVHEAGFFPRKLVGRSGRGDTCLAAYAARRLSSPPAESTVWAAALTSLKMEAEGPFLQGTDEVEHLIRTRYGAS